MNNVQLLKRIPNRPALIRLLEVGMALPTDGRFMLFGIRNTNGKPDEWCDVIGYLHGQEYGIYVGTTRPGVSMLRRPINAKGTSILVSGHYTDMYRLGLHQNRADHAAFVQVGPCLVVRDNDKDSQWDVDGPRDLGIFGINLHRANRNSEATVVGDHSAGCQVVRRLVDHVALLQAAGRSGQDRFDYRLVRAAL